MAETKQKQLERRITVSMSRCVHFTGVQHDACESGVRYDSLRTEPPSSLPCLPLHATEDRPVGHCAKRLFPTREAVEAEILASDASYGRISTCLKAIKAKHGKARGLADQMPCPNACGGVLRYSIAGYNGHIHGQCSTPNCASWMQ